MLKNGRGFNQVIIMIFLTLLIQIVMLLINSITAAKFGASIGLDSYNLSKNISNFIFGLVGTAITTIIIPNLSKDKLGNKGLNTFITVIYILMTFMMILVFFFKKYLIFIISGNSEQIFIDSTQIILNIILISYYFLSFSNVLIAVYQVRNKFNFIKLVQLISNLIVLLLLYFIKDISITKYSLFIGIGNITNFIILLLGFKNMGYDYRVELQLKNKEFKKMIKNLIPILFAAGIYQISLMIDTMLVTREGDGFLSILSYSTNIVGMISTLFIGNLVMYVYPKLALKMAQKDGAAERLYSKYLIYIIALMVLLVVGFLVIGKEFIMLLLQRGKFTVDETNMVYIATSLYIISLPFSAARDISYRYFYSNNDTRTPFKNSLKITILNVSLSILLAKYLGLNGVVLGTTISSIFSAILIKMKLKKEFKINFLKDSFQELSIILIAGIIVYIFGKMIVYSLEGQNIILRMGISTLLISIFYLCTLLIFRFKPLIDLRKEVKIQF